MSTMAVFGARERPRWESPGGPPHKVVCFCVFLFFQPCAFENNWETPPPVCRRLPAKQAVDAANTGGAMAFPGALSSFAPSPTKIKVAEVLPYPKPLSHRGEKPAEVMRQAIKKCVLFEGLSTHEVKFVLQTARPITTSEGAVLYDQADAPSFFYLVHTGTYRAECTTADGTRKARDYGPLDNFGACELLSTMGGRTCSVRVLTPGKLWAIPMRTVQVKLRVPPPLSAPGLLDFCREVKLFQDISRERLVQLCRGAVQYHVAQNEPVFKENEEAMAIYALRSGSLVTSQSDSDFSMTMTPPESFGESALFPDDELRVRRAAVLAGSGGAVVVRWNVAAIETLIGFELQAASLALFNRKMLESVTLAKRHLVDGMQKDDMDTLIGLMMRRSFEERAPLAEEGEFDAAFFIIESGEAVVKKGEGAKSEILTLKRGDCFGEQALVPQESLKRTKRKASVIAKGPQNVVCLALTPEAFHNVQHGSLLGWTRQLATDIATTAVGGVDSVVSTKAGSASVSALSPQAKGQNKPGAAAAQKRQAALEAAQQASAAPQAADVPPPSAPPLLPPPPTGGKPAGSSAGGSPASARKRTDSPKKR